MFKKLKLAVALSVSLMTTSVVQADYRDAINLPALQKSSAPDSLMLDVAKAGDNFVAVGERGHILVSNDQANSWQQVQVPTRMQLNATYFSDANTGWAVGEDEVILKTTDAGNTWLMQHNGVETDTSGPLLDVLFTTSEKGFAVGVFNKLYQTVDGGETWDEWYEHIDNLDEWHLISLASTGENSQTIYITSEMGLLFKSTDGGDMFNPVQTDHDGSFHGILARENAEGVDQLVLVGVGGVLYTTLDGGKTWNLLDTDTEDGLAGGTWLADGSALIVGANGTLIKVARDLQSAEKFQTENGLPLSSAIQLNAEETLMVGFGGTHRFQLPQQAQ